MCNEGLWDKIFKVFSDARAAINARGMRKKYYKMLEDLKNGKISEDEVKKFVNDNSDCFVKAVKDLKVLLKDKETKERFYISDDDIKDAIKVLSKYL